MCEPVSIMAATGVAMGAAGGIMSAKNAAKAEGAQEDARRRNLHEQSTAMYRSQADMRLEVADKHQEATRQLTNVNLTALRNRGTINAALGESLLTGNSMERIRRNVENDASNEKMGILDNYERDYASLFQNEVANYENTKAAFRGSTPNIRTSKLAHALNVVNSGMQGGLQGAQVGQAYKSA